MSTRTPTRPTPTRTPLDSDSSARSERPRAARPVTARRRGPRVDLSMTQVIASAFAAVTATVAGSFLGVTGTVLGAAVASVVTVIGNAVYGSSLRHTRDRVRAVVPAGRRQVVARTSPRPTRPSRPSRPTPGPGRTGDHEPPVLPSRAPRPRRERVAGRTPWRGIALGTIGVFVSVLAAVTVVEFVAGRPLSDLVRDDSGSGTSVFGGQRAGSTTPSVPTPTVTVTVTPKVVTTTPTMTQTAPAATQTVTPTTTTTGTPTANPTGTTAGSSATASDSASPQSVGTPSTLG